MLGEEEARRNPGQSGEEVLKVEISLKLMSQGEKATPKVPRTGGVARGTPSGAVVIAEKAG